MKEAKHAVKIRNPLPDAVLSLSGVTADRLIALGDGDAALMYLHLLRRGSGAPDGWTQTRAERAAERLACADLAEAGAAAPVQAAPESDEPPEYSGSEIAAALTEQSAFAGLADELERQLGKKLTAADLKTLYTLYDHLALPPEVILLAAAWCAREVEQKYGPGRKPFLSQIRREAFRWSREGVDTAEAAEEHLRRLLRLRSREGEIARILHLPDRPLVERERGYIASWIEMGFEDDALRLAYEKTVMGAASKSMDWRYMNGILRRWHEKGLHTAAQVTAGDGAPRSPAPTAGRTAAPDRQGREDMERIRRIMDQMKQEQGG